MTAWAETSTQTSDTDGGRRERPARVLGVSEGAGDKASRAGEADDAACPFDSGKRFAHSQNGRNQGT
jgi:hypothetical protein